MMVSHSRLRQIGWAAVLAACIGLFLVLSFRVHAVKSEVLLAERQIIALQRADRLRKPGRKNSAQSEPEGGSTTSG